MAAIFIVAGLVIAEKIEKKKEKKRQKKANVEARYRELQIETNRRLARRESGNVIENSFVEEGEDEHEDEDENQRVAMDDVPPPPYEDAVQAGERREREWQSEMQRRRSSVNSKRGRSSAST